MPNTFSRSFQLVKESFSVLNKDRKILIFPLLSLIVNVILLSFFVISLFLFKLPSGFIYVILLFFYYLILYFVGIFFNASLVTYANIRLNGGNPSFSDGIRNSFRNIGKIFLWAIISATIGIILKVIADKSKTFSKIVVSLIGIAWSLLTFFIVPVLVLENLGLIDSIKKSGYLFKKTWGENAIGNLSIGAFFILLFIIGLVPLALIAYYYTVWVFLILVFYVIILSILSSSLTSIYTVALYNYANTEKISFFSQETIKKAFI